MLGRAVRDHQASRPAVPPAPKAGGNAALQKQLFPSSSPRAGQDGRILQQFQKVSSGSSTFRASTVNTHSGVPSGPGYPLKPRSANPTWTLPMSPEKRTEHNRHTTGAAFASLYNQSDSFKSAPEGPILLDDETQLHGQGKTADLPVHIDLSDFSDDDDLDFDCKFPTPPPAPPPPPSQPKPVEYLTSPSNISSTCVSWSESSPSHFAPRPSHPVPITSSSIKREPSHGEPPARKVSAKRESPHDDRPAPVPIAKKRALPKNFQRQPDFQEFAYVPDAVATPKPQRKDREPWNTTASAVKDQKRQLKDKHKKSVSTESAEPVADEVPAAKKSNEPSKPAVVALSSEQRNVLNLVCNRSASVFFTGPAGTGKSVLMRAIIQELRKKWARDPERLAVTASTGLAACNIGGMTLHSFAGIGLGKEDAQTLVRKIRRNQKIKNRWLKTKTLIIDEVSMVDGELFDKLSQIGRILRNNGRPWGGIQLVITGDFFQLPPVPDGDKKRDIKFAFEAATWATSMDHTIGLTEVFRQKDPEFANMLNEMRLGRISEETVQAFKSMSKPLQFDDNIEVTELFPTRYEVERSNEQRLKALPGLPFKYSAFDTGQESVRDRLLQHMMAPKSLVLKENAQVMLIKNMDDTLVNGSLGTVIGFQTEDSFNAFGGDDGYGSGDDVDPAFKKRMSVLKSQLESGGAKSADKFPVVRFHAVDGSQRTLLLVPEEWKVELPNGEVQASRKQLPLILAWALSIHKAQGQTLDRVKVDLGKVFEKGQAYVALSRATSQQGLQVLRFEAHKVMAHPRVVQFYDKLYSVDSAMKPKTVAATTTITGFASRSTASASASSFAGKNASASAFSLAAKKSKHREFMDDDEVPDDVLAAYC